MDGAIHRSTQSPTTNLLPRHDYDAPHLSCQPPPLTAYTTDRYHELCAGHAGSLNVIVPVSQLHTNAARCPRSRASSLGTVHERKKFLASSGHQLHPPSSAMALTSTSTLVILLLLTLVSPSIVRSATRAAPHRDRPSALSLFPQPSLHIFFYAWYGAPPHDVGYLHWTHSVLPHWTPEVTNQHRKEPYVAPGDPGITYYPSRGLYSSHDSDVLEAQMAEMAEMGVEVVVVSWWGQKHKNSSVREQPCTSRPRCRIEVQSRRTHRLSLSHSLCVLSQMDGQGVGSDHCMPAILDAAEKAGVKVAIHVSRSTTSHCTSSPPPNCPFAHACLVSYSHGCVCSWSRTRCAVSTR